MLQGVPDETRRADPGPPPARWTQRGVEGVAAIAVAMEAARGATILGRILPGETGAFPRPCRGPSDHDGAWRWLTGIAENLARSQADLDDALNQRPGPPRDHRSGDCCTTFGVPCRRADLDDAIDALAYCWTSRAVLDMSMTSGEFETRPSRR